MFNVTLIAIEQVTCASQPFFWQNCPRTDRRRMEMDLAFLTDVTEMLNDLTCSSKAGKTNMWHIFPHKNIWGETSTACGTSAKKQDFTHLPVTQRLSLSWETSAPFPLESQWKRWKCWKEGVWACDSVSYMSTLKKSVFSKNPFAADVDEALPCYQFEVGWSYRTVMFWKTHFCPTVSL